MPVAAQSTCPRQWMRAAAAKYRCCKDVSCQNERSRMTVLGEETTGHREAALAGQHSLATAAAHAHEAAVHTMVRFPHVLVGRSVALYLFSAANHLSFLQ